MKIHSDCCGCVTSTHLGVHSDNMGKSAGWALDPTSLNDCIYLHQLGSKLQVSILNSIHPFVDHLQYMVARTSHFVVFGTNSTNSRDSDPCSYFHDILGFDHSGKPCSTSTSAVQH